VPAVDFTVWSDFLCPWCYVASVRIDRLQQEFPDVLSVEWRSYLLKPEAEPLPLEEFRDYTRLWSRPAELEPACRFTTWAGDTSPPSHSIPSAIASKVAATFGERTTRAYRQVLFEAYFSDNRDVSDLDVLLDLADDAGVDPADFADRWNEDRNGHVEAVLRDHNVAIELGVTGAPGLLINGEHVLTGALEMDDYRRIVRHLAQLD
jgi:predicted DsbA family dithiol-disulfide isomerase